MALEEKPHSFIVYAPVESADDDHRVEALAWEEEGAQVQGQIEPLTAERAYLDYAIELRRPLRLLADPGSAESFPLGALVHCASRSQWGRVVSPPIVLDAEPETAHIVVLLEQCRPDGGDPR